MRGPQESAIAVRLSNGEIEVTRVKLNTWSSKSILKLPLIRGFVALIDSLIAGIRALTFSVKRSLGEEEIPWCRA